MISEDLFGELEGIVGAEYAVREPAVLDSYVWQSLPGEDQDIWLRRPAAVVLPASTEEVRAVVEACRRAGLRCTAFATGWGAYGAPTTDDVVQLDLCRMNRVIEIDAQAKTALIEPGVCAAQLQAEAMKAGLDVRVPPSGPCDSPLPAFLFAPGGGGEVPPGEVADGLVAVECVLPDGEIVELNLEEGGGRVPAGGEVVTRGVVRLRDWPGPAEVEVKGLLFDAEVEVPESVRFHLCFFPDDTCEEKAAEALEAADTGYLSNHASFGSLLYMLAPNLFDAVSETEALGGLVRKALGNACAVMLASESPDGFERREEELRRAVEEAGGVVVGTARAPRIAAFLLACYLRSAAVPRAGRGWGTPDTFLAELQL